MPALPPLQESVPAVQSAEASAPSPNNPRIGPLPVAAASNVVGAGDEAPLPIRLAVLNSQPTEAGRTQPEFGDKGVGVSGAAVAGDANKIPAPAIAGAKKVTPMAERTN